ncbi:hypothetical protein GCM10017586_12520 [Microbacterium imperiale]|uniref:WXG100 family type VII secretion target n=2 Tax=Microbacterium imperiale TaxID=33884 RepID=A0A9W6HGD6_9MICO|nr:hypothetical protein GCM10017544_20060 [Microbacterium imperiale]GLJ79570.1 hypothetical protein GCM10017586_12520 [Microbacterium imperiale]
MVDRNDPGAGDPSAMAAMADDWGERAESIRSSQTSVRSAAEAASGSSWSGEAHDAFQRQVAAVEPDLLVLATGMSAAAGALRGYAEVVRAIKDEQDSLARRRAVVEDEREELRGQLRVARAESSNNYVSFPEPVARARALEIELGDTRDALDAVEAEWDALCERRAAADDALISALSSRDVRGALGVFARGGAAAIPRGGLLTLVASLSEADLRPLVAVHPEVLDQIRSVPPAEVATWWGALVDGTRTLLVNGIPELIGTLGGIPAVVREAANRLVAAANLEMLLVERSKLALDGPVAVAGPSGVASPWMLRQILEHVNEQQHQDRLAALDTEIAYLKRVVAGDVSLYHYDRDRQQIIEMFGDVSKADVIMSFMPGTNTTMESFYSSTADEGLTSLTRRMVEYPPDGVELAGFVLKQGFFPNLAPPEVAVFGPQVNLWALPLGSRYAAFEEELDVITDSTPLLSVEHSFGSSPGGQAERLGADFQARVVLAGIGMLEGWEPQDGTAYYAIQGPTDINRAFDGMQVDPFGYAVTASEENGFTELDSGFTGFRPFGQHGDVISPDPSVNLQTHLHLERIFMELANQ